MNAQLSAFLATEAGGILWSLVTVMGVILSPKIDKVDDNQALKKAVFNGIAALVSCAIAGWFVDPAIIRHFKVTDVSTVNIVGLAIGLVFWPVLPGVIQLLSKFSLSSLGGFIQGMQGGSK